MSPLRRAFLRGSPTGATGFGRQERRALQRFDVAETRQAASRAHDRQIREGTYLNRHGIATKVVPPAAPES
jgi:hypothetical protein